MDNPSQSVAPATNPTLPGPLETVMQNNNLPLGNNTDSSLLTGDNSGSSGLISGLSALEQQQQQQQVQQQPIVVQKEAELKEMQNQIESYSQMVKQLTSQREMAVKKLADMDSQIQELNKILEVERLQVETKDQELKSKRTKLQALKNEEDELKAKFGNTKQELEAAAENLSNNLMYETQVKSKLTDLKEFLNKTSTALDDIERAITYKDTIKLSALCDHMLMPPTPLTTNTQLTNGMRSQEHNSTIFSNQDNLGQSLDRSGAAANFADPFAGTDPFEGDDPFESDDPFKAEEQASLTLPEDDPFNPSNSNAVGTTTTTSTSAFPTSGLANDPFAPGLDGF